MRANLVVGNWKMHLTPAQAIALIEPVVSQVNTYGEKDVVVCPSYVCLPAIHEVLRNSSIKLGAQDTFWKDDGAYTGQISPSMLTSLGCQYCIVGHSEKRGRFGNSDFDEASIGYFSDSDRTVNLKVQALLFHSITPIVCVGETQAERDAGHTDQVIHTQLAGAFDGLDAAEIYSTCVAYEPVWAIGTGNTCEAQEANRVCSTIRDWLTQRCGEELADYVRVLYGGSVKASNSDDLFKQEFIDGGLVGGASLNANEFARIVMSA